MKIIKTIILSLLLLSSLSSIDAETSYSNGSHQQLRWELCQETENYYNKYNVDRDWNEYRIFMYSAYRVSKMFPMYPAKNDLDRMLLFYELGQHETMWRKNFAVANVPKAKYKGGEMNVKNFSIDYTAWGLNEGNVEWTYETARRIQAGKPVQRGLPRKTRDELNRVVIPKDLKLNRIDLSISKRAKEKYKKLLSLGYMPNKIRKSIKIKSYKEYTQDQIDSALIYRIIVEIDRRNRGWPWGIAQYNIYSTKMDRTLYYRLSRKVEGYNYRMANKDIDWNNTAVNPYYIRKGSTERES